MKKSETVKVITEDQYLKIFSTLCSVLMGVYREGAGEVELDLNNIPQATSAAARRCAAFIHGLYAPYVQISDAVALIIENQEYFFLIPRRDAQRGDKAQ